MALDQKARLAITWSVECKAALPCEWRLAFPPPARWDEAKKAERDHLNYHKYKRNQRRKAAGGK